MAVEFPIHAKINYQAVKEKKAEAARCHASQGGEGLTRGFMRLISWLVRAKPEDQFMLAEPRPQPDLQLDDLFEEIES